MVIQGNSRPTLLPLIPIFLFSSKAILRLDEQCSSRGFNSDSPFSNSFARKSKISSQLCISFTQHDVIENCSIHRVEPKSQFSQSVPGAHISKSILRGAKVRSELR